MTPEAQRIAIAEAVPNWRPSHGGKYCTHIERDLDNPTSLPGIFDPLSDLNAMHEAEKVLKKEQHWAYIKELIELTHAEWTDSYEEVMVVAHATAAQRAEAFLRTIGKWEETKPEPARQQA